MIERTAMLLRLAQVIRRKVLQRYRPDSCVLASKVVVEAAKRLGLGEGQMISASVGVYNPWVARRYNPARGRLRDLGRLAMQRKGWSVGVGHAQTGWCGHVVALISGEVSVLVDASIDQASRPDKGIVVRPVAHELPPGFDARQRAISFPAHGCLLVYELKPDDRDWTVSGDLGAETVWLALVDEVVAELSGVKS